MSAAAPERMLPLYHAVESMIADKVLSPNCEKIIKGMLDAEVKSLVTVADRHRASSQEELKGAIVSALISEMQQMWDELFVNHSTSEGKRLSTNERTALGLNLKTLVYGEITFQSFGEVLLKKLKLAPGGKFYDLGSGTGRAVFAASILHDFDSCVGIEILEGLHNASQDVLRKYREDFLPKLDDKKKQQQIRFIKGDILKYDWSDADVVFANSTCFDDPLMAAISRKAELLKDGAYVICFTKQLHTNAFKLIDQQLYRQSWGDATVLVYKKKATAEVFSAPQPSSPSVDV